MVTNLKNIKEFIKRDFWHTFKNSLFLAVTYLLIIPIIRGIKNLDNIQSAQCLGQTVTLIGIIIIVPITGQELEKEIKEIIYIKPWAYIKSIFIRLLLSIVFISLLIMIFTLIMAKNNCVFSYYEFTFSTIIYSLFLGLLGLTLSQIGNNIVIGYLGTLGYWSFNYLKIIEESDIIYLFPIINGILDYQKLIALIVVIGCLLCVFLFIIKYN